MTKPNPYQPPSSTQSKDPRKPQSTLAGRERTDQCHLGEPPRSWWRSIRAVVVGGFFVDHCSGSLTSFLALLIAAAWLQDFELADNWYHSELELLPKSISILAAFAGGWTAGEIAQRRQAWHGLSSAALGKAIAYGIHQSTDVGAGHENPLSWLALAILCCVAGALGGKLTSKDSQPQQATKSENRPAQSA